MKHRAQQQLGKIELDGLPEALARGLQLVADLNNYI